MSKMANEKRLIDADAEIEAIKKYACKGCESYNGIKYRSCWADDLISWIKDAPKVDAVEVVHGRWIHVPSSDMMTGKAYKCSECGKMRYGSYMPNYCQCCGAKMDGDGNGS